MWLLNGLLLVEKSFGRRLIGEVGVWQAVGVPRKKSSFASVDSDALPYRTDTYENLHAESLRNPGEFWAEQADRLVWFKKWTQVLDHSKPPFTRWFVSGKLNTCYNCLDRHVLAGKGQQAALIYDSPVTATKRSYTYKELLEMVALFAGVLTNHGVRAGDCVLIYMPMIPEAVIAMLACARIGAIHSVVFGGFAAKELAARISHCSPKVILSASGGIEPGRIIEYKPILDQAVAMATVKPASCIIYQRPGMAKTKLEIGRDFDWSAELSHAKRQDCVELDANAPLYVLYTSGTTGAPKGIVRPSGGHAVVLPWAMQIIYGMRPGETWWGASDLGWVVGHSYICYGPLLYGLTTVLYEGKPVGTPDASQYFRVITEHNVASVFYAPTALRAIRQHDHEGRLAKAYTDSPNWKIRTILAAGEHLDIETRHWAQRIFKVPVLDHWWQTESGWPITATCVGVKNPDLDPPKDASGKPVPGWDVHVLKQDTSEVADSEELGRVVARLPLPPGCATTFWQADDRFKRTYFEEFPGFYDTMDAGSMTADRFLCIMSRADDVINVAGHRISSGALEEAILAHPDVVDCAVIGIDDKLKGTVPFGLCVLRGDYEGIEATLCEEIVNLVRQEVGPVAAFKRLAIVPKLPKTRSGKIARNTLTAMANNLPFKIPVTIEDASVYPTIRKILRDQGLAVIDKETTE